LGRVPEGEVTFSTTIGETELVIAAQALLNLAVFGSLWTSWKLWSATYRRQL